MTEIQFQEQVFERSHQIAVVVDFWAEWCGPCRFLGPVIEKLAGESSGKWELIKVNTDESPEIATNFQIMSIPAVKMFYQGKVIAEFVGALPEYQIIDWLNQHLPDENKELLAVILSQLQEKETYEQALNELKLFVISTPDNKEATIALAKEIVNSDPEEAKKLVGDIKLGEPFYEEASDILSLANLESCIEHAEEPIATFLRAAHEQAKHRHWDLALSYLIQSLEKDKHFCDDISRKAIIAIFHFLGEQHEITKKYRPKFSMALY